MLPRMLADGLFDFISGGWNLWEGMPDNGIPFLIRSRGEGPIAGEIHFLGSPQDDYDQESQRLDPQYRVLTDFRSKKGTWISLGYRASKNVLFNPNAAADLHYVSDGFTPGNPYVPGIRNSVLSLGNSIGAGFGCNLMIQPFFFKTRSYFGYAERYKTTLVETTLFFGYFVPDREQ